MINFLRLFAAFLFFLPLSAQAKMSTVENPKTAARQIESYLNGLKTMQARFVQTAPDGSQQVGTFYLQRPGKLRFEYDPPNEDFVVADGLFIYFYDSELGEQTNAPIGQTLADFLLRDDIKLRDDIRIESLKKGGGFLQIELSQSADRSAGRLMMAFNENPLALRKWRIVDPQGLITEVELLYPKIGITHPGGLFSYHDPDHGQKPRYNE